MVHSTFEYFPGLPICHSKDLVNWEIVGYCISEPEQMQFTGVNCSDGLYAPTIRYHEGTFYVVCTNVSIGGNFYITATDPAGPWSEPILVDQGGIDPSLLFDTDGKVYFTSNGWEEKGRHTVAFIQQSEIDIKTGKLLTEPRRISYGTGGRCLEAPHLYHVGDWYYLACAEGGTDLRHMVTVFRSKSPWGPFESHPDNPILTARDENRPPLSAVGHADLFEDKYGKFWMCFLCYRTIGKYHHLGRETGLVPIEWTEDGFENSSQLGLKWNFLRECFSGYSFGTELQKSDGSSGKKGLFLYGNEYTLDDVATPAWIGKRQQHFKMKSEALVNAKPKKEDEDMSREMLRHAISGSNMRENVR